VLAALEGDDVVCVSLAVGPAWTTEEVGVAVRDELTAELVYPTLTAWGMHRMGPNGAKRVEYDAFTDALRRQADAVRGAEPRQCGGWSIPSSAYSESTTA